MSEHLRGLIAIWEDAIAVLDRQIAALEQWGRVYSSGHDTEEFTNLWLDQLTAARALHAEAVADWRIRLDAVDPNAAPDGFQRFVPTQHRA